jgi:hypothetical protein
MTNEDRARAGRLGAAARRKQKGDYAKPPAPTPQETLDKWAADRERVLAAALAEIERK